MNIASINVYCERAIYIIVSIAGRAAKNYTRKRFIKIIIIKKKIPCSMSLCFHTLTIMYRVLIVVLTASPALQVFCRIKTQSPLPVEIEMAIISNNFSVQNVYTLWQRVFEHTSIQRAQTVRKSIFL